LVVGMSWVPLTTVARARLRRLLNAVEFAVLAATVLIVALASDLPTKVRNVMT